MTIRALEGRLAAKLHWAWDDGCPVAGSSEGKRVAIAEIARRRWNSFERRRPDKLQDNRVNRIDDLARGLCEKCENGGLSMAGPLITDYRWLAGQLAEAFLSDPE
jgi:hypothetical protein